MSQWKTLLEDYSVELQEDNHLLLTKAPQDSTTKIVPLTQYGAISVLGEDASKFLQGQLSCDVSEVETLGSRLGAHCTIKGSIHALYRLISIEGGFLLRLNADCLDSALTNIKKYIIFSKAQASDVSEAYLGLGIIGAGSTTLLEPIFGALPTETDSIAKSGNMTLVRVPGNRFELWAPETELPELLKQFTQLAPLGSTQDWLQSEIKAGIPDITAATQDSYIPQMANLQALHGVSFQKGCYTGQEIVTRLQHRGKLNKFMMLATANSESTPEIGSPISTETKDSIGQVLQAVKLDNNQVLLQAIVNKKDFDEHTLLLGSKTGPELAIHPLPYELDPRLFERKN